MAVNGKTAMQPIEEEIMQKRCVKSSTRILNTMSTGLRSNAYRNGYEEVIKGLRRQLETIDERA